MISRRRWKARTRWIRPLLLVTAINIAVFAFTAGPAIADSIRVAGGLSLGLADSLYCKLTGCTMTGAITLPVKACPSAMEVAFSGTTNSGICDIGGTATRFGWYHGGTLVFEADTGQGMAVNTKLAISKGILSNTSTMTNAGTGSCTSVTVTGTVLDGTITATCTAAQTVIVTFSDGFGASPNCVITSANSAAGAVTTGTPYQSAGSTTSATFTFPAVTAGKYNVICAL